MSNLNAAQYAEQSQSHTGSLLNFSVRNQVCPNEDCLYFNRNCAGNVTVHSRRYQRFMCKKCSKTWVAHRQDVTYRLHSEAQTLHLSLLMTRAGQSVRRVAHELGVSPSTVQRWKAKQLVTV